MAPSIITIALLLAGATDVSVETLDGKTVAGSLVALDQKSVTLEADGKRNQLPIATVAKIVQKDVDSAKPARSSVWLTMADDVQLTASSYHVRGDQAEVRLVTGQLVKVPRKNVRHVRLKLQDATIATQWKKILATRAEADLLVVRKSGKIDFLEGVVQDVDGERVQFKFDGDVIPVKLEKVEGIIYHAREIGEVPDAKATFVTIDGARLPAIAWKLDVQGNLNLTTPLGLKITQPVTALLRADLTAGKLIYLGDLEPVATKWTPYIGGGEELPLLEVMFGPRSDRAMDGGPLRLGGQDYRKGLSLHSRTELTYDLKGKYRRFKALAGIDDRTRDRGHVVFVIKGDAKVIFTAEFSGKDEPRELDLDVTSVRRLEIMVDYGKDLDISDHMNLVDARIVK